MLRLVTRSLFVMFALFSAGAVFSASAHAACGLDGFNHPSVSMIFGQQTDPGTCNAQIVSGCNAVLVSPTVAITSAGCADLWATGGGFNLTATWLNHNPASGADCVGADRIASYHVHPSWDGTNASPYNIGVIVLDAPSAQAPAALPSAGAVALLERGDPLDVAAYSSTDGFATTMRRGQTVTFARDTDFHFKVKATGGACPTQEGAGAFEFSSQDILGMSVNANAGFLRLDIPEVRSFLSGFVTLP
jgi:hypothetical protein